MYSTTNTHILASFQLYLDLASKRKKIYFIITEVRISLLPSRRYFHLYTCKIKHKVFNTDCKLDYLHNTQYSSKSSRQYTNNTKKTVSNTLKEYGDISLETMGPFLLYFLIISSNWSTNREKNQQLVKNFFCKVSNWSFYWVLPLT